MEGNIDALCRDWLDAKRAEAAANARRIVIEGQLAQAFDVPDEGSKTHKTAEHKVNVTQPITRKVDADVWSKVKDRIPPELWPVRVKIEADATGCKYLAKNEPDLWLAVSDAFEVKPGKIGFKVEGL